MKRERNSGLSRQSNLPARPRGQQPKQQASFKDGYTAIRDLFSGGNLVVIDSNGVAHGEEASRQMYWSDVCEGIRERGAECLPEMAALGSFMNLSILDAKIPVIDSDTGKVEAEDIYTAMFLLDQVGCFEWLMQESRRGCKGQMVGQVLKEIVLVAPHLENETPKMAMAKLAARFLVEWFHDEGELDMALANGNSTMSRPFVKRAADDFKAEIRAKQERAELEAVVASGTSVEARECRRI